MLRSLGAAALGACGGLIVGATQADHQALRIVTNLLTASNPAEPPVDPTDANSLVAASTRLADKAGGLCVLSTRSADGGSSSRMIQPLIETDDAGSPSLRFHTTARSTKFGELTADGRVRSPSSIRRSSRASSSRGRPSDCRTPRSSSCATRGRSSRRCRSSTRATR